MYLRYDKKVFCFIEKYIDITNLSLLLSKGDIVLVEVEETVVLLGLSSSQKKGCMKFLGRFFKKKTIVILFIYLILLLDLQVHKNSSSQFDLVRYEHIIINKVLYIDLNLLSNYLNSEIFSLGNLVIVADRVVICLEVIVDNCNGIEIHYSRDVLVWYNSSSILVIHNSSIVPVIPSSCERWTVSSSSSSKITSLVQVWL